VVKPKNITSLIFNS